MSSGGAVADCCRVGGRGLDPPTQCPGCGKVGRTVEPITLSALLAPAALERRSPGQHRFCANEVCPIVYFGDGETFISADLIVPVFQKEPVGSRTVCYCLGITEAELRQQVDAADRTAVQRIRQLVNEGRCACEVRNPQGSCCLGNVVAVTGSPEGRAQPAGPPQATEPAEPGAPGRGGS